MAINHSINNESSPTANGKKPYEKPGFRFEKIFVTSALSCGKTGTEGSCMGNPKMS